ncbi:MAG TPA: hypothetical protein VN776_15665 [Terracidiphilus sp.]|nr:hypothetical protein [Terracidiphilus sp.]
MANGLSTQVESSLATAVRNYLLAGQNERISEDENLRPVCRWLARLLSDLLKSEGGWDRYNSVDDVIPCTADRVSPSDLVFTGLLIWLGGSKSNEWKDPLFAAIHVSENAPEHLTYEIRFANADRGLGKCPYGSPHDFPYVPVNNWLFTFVSSDACG